MSTSYETNDLIAGPVETDQVAFAAGTYYRGQALEYAAGTGYFQNLSSGNMAGIFLGEETTLAAGDYDSVARGGDFYEEGVVDGNGDQLTITETMREAWAARGFYVKRV